MSPANVLDATAERLVGELVSPELSRPSAPAPKAGLYCFAMLLFQVSR